MLNKKRLLQQFALPTHLKQAYESKWTRALDLFGDQFVLTAHVDDSELSYTYHRIREENSPECIWAITIRDSKNHRASVNQSEGIDPPIKSIVRAVDLIRSTIEHTQANPVISTQPHTKKKRSI